MINLTKVEMTKVIVTALYNLNELVTEKNHVAWAHALKLARWKKKDLAPLYKNAYNILSNK